MVFPVMMTSKMIAGGDVGSWWAHVATTATAYWRLWLGSGVKRKLPVMTGMMLGGQPTTTNGERELPPDLF